MATIGETTRPAFAYDSATDTWIPVGVGPHAHTPAAIGAISSSLTTTTGDLIYAASANTPARLGIGITGQVLTVSGGIPAWATASGGFPAWTSYTPTVTAAGGTFTYTSTGWYSQSGTTVAVIGNIAIASVGTAAGTMSATLPFTAKTRTGAIWQGPSQEVDATGKAGSCNVSSADNFCRIRDYNFGTFFVAGYRVCFSLVYEVA
jgi:hypothetical protein